MDFFILKESESPNLKKVEMIKKHQDFTEIIKNQNYIQNKNFVIYNKESKFTYPHYGIAVSKKLGNAVIRNKCKRRMRVILDKYKNQLRSDKDYIIIMKENSSKINFQQLEESFKTLLERTKYEEKK